MNRLLIIGARGFLGAYLAAAANGRYEVYQGDRDSPVENGGVLVDVTRQETVRAAFDSVRPDAVALLAGIADIDRCEREPELAKAVNLHGAATVAEECARTGARLLFTSTGAVFDGTRPSYAEGDAPTPLSVYGETKARAEGAIQSLIPEAIIVRIALALGFAVRGGTNAILNKLSDSLRAGKTVASPTFEKRNPIDAAGLADCMIRLMESPGTSGIYHIGSSEAWSRYDLNCAIAERLGYSCSLVFPQTNPIPGRAPRGANHFLVSERLSRQLDWPIPTTEQVIESAIHATA